MIFFFKKILSKLYSITFFYKKPKENYLSKRDNQEPNQFSEVKSWAEDRFISLLVSRNRYRIISMILVIILILQLILCCCLIPIQHLQPLLIHHYSDGRVVIDRPRKTHITIDRTQIENDIVRYVVNRESYDPAAYAEQYHLIMWMSDETIARQYADFQRSTNKSSPIQTLGNHGYRTVHIDDIVFLDQLPTDIKKSLDHHNLAEVHAVIVDHSLNTSVRRSQAVTIMLSWQYKQPSTNPDVRWRNWDGFQVTHYQIKNNNLVVKS